MLITPRMIDLQKKHISRIWKYRGRLKWTECQPKSQECLRTSFGFNESIPVSQMVTGALPHPVSWVGCTGYSYCPKEISLSKFFTELSNTCSFISKYKQSIKHLDIDKEPSSVWKTYWIFYSLKYG